MTKMINWLEKLIFSVILWVGEAFVPENYHAVWEVLCHYFTFKTVDLIIFY